MATRGKIEDNELLDRLWDTIPIATGACMVGGGIDMACTELLRQDPVFGAVAASVAVTGSLLAGYGAASALRKSVDTIGAALQTSAGIAMSAFMAAAAYAGAAGDAIGNGMLVVLSAAGAAFAGMGVRNILRLRPQGERQA